jgi:hypothetical protein
VAFVGVCVLSCRRFKGSNKLECNVQGPRSMGWCGDQWGGVGLFAKVDLEPGTVLIHAAKDDCLSRKSLQMFPLLLNVVDTAEKRFGTTMHVFGYFFALLRKTKVHHAATETWPASCLSAYHFTPELKALMPRGSFEHTWQDTVEADLSRYEWLLESIDSEDFFITFEEFQYGVCVARSRSFRPWSAGVSTNLLFCECV